MPSVTHNACVIKSAEYFHDITVKKNFCNSKTFGLLLHDVFFFKDKVSSAQ